MKAALISNLVGADFAANERRIVNLANRAADMGAELVVFPEAAATDLVNTGCPEHDLAVAEEVPGARSREWQRLAKTRGVWFAAGLLEREDGRIYDAGLVFSPDGELVLKYRRNHPGWHGPHDDPAIYREGVEIPVIETGFGRLGMLICGDLWDERILSRLREAAPDCLLYLMARSLAENVNELDFERDELPAYRALWSRTGARVLAVNLCGQEPDAPIGGAWFASQDGRLLASLPMRREGILTVELG